MMFEKIMEEKRNDISPPFLICNGMIRYEGRKYCVREKRVDANKRLFDSLEGGSEGDYILEKRYHPSTLRQDDWEEYHFKSATMDRIFGISGKLTQRWYKLPKVEEVFQVCTADKFFYFITANHIDLLAAKEE